MKIKTYVKLQNAVLARYVFRGYGQTRGATAAAVGQIRGGHAHTNPYPLRGGVYEQAQVRQVTLLLQISRASSLLGASPNARLGYHT